MRIKVAQHLSGGYINSAWAKWLPPEYFFIGMKLDVSPSLTAMWFVGLKEGWKAHVSFAT